MLGHVSPIAAGLVGLARSQLKMSATVIVAAYRQASLSYRVATARNCLRRFINRSTWLRWR
jgi:hypothetical protein